MTNLAARRPIPDPPAALCTPRPPPNHYEPAGDEMTDQPTITDQAIDAYSAGIRAFINACHANGDHVSGIRDGIRAGLAAAAPHIAAQYDTELEAALDSASTVLAMSSRDWSTSHDLAWLYGIFCGWDDDPTGGDVDQLDAMSEVAARHGWNADDVARLRRLHAAIELAGRPGSSAPTRTEQPSPVWAGGSLGQAFQAARATRTE